MSSKEEPQPQLHLRHHASLNSSTDGALHAASFGNQSTGGHTSGSTGNADAKRTTQPGTMKDHKDSGEAHAQGTVSNDADDVLDDESTLANSTASDDSVKAAIAAQTKRPSGPTDVEKEPVPWLDPSRYGNYDHHHHHHHSHTTEASRDAHVEKALCSTDLDEVKAALEAQTRRLAQARAHLRDERKATGKQLSARDARIRSLQAQVGALEAQVKPLQAKSHAAARLRTRVAELEETIRELRQRLAKAPSTGQASHRSRNSIISGARGDDAAGSEGLQGRRHSELEQHQAQRIAQLEMELEQLRRSVGDESRAIAQLSSFSSAASSSMLADTSRQPSMSFLVNEIVDAHDRSLSLATLAGSSTRRSLGSLSTSPTGSAASSVASSPWVSRRHGRAAGVQQGQAEEHDHQSWRQPLVYAGGAADNDSDSDGGDGGANNAHVSGLEKEVERLRAELGRTRERLQRVRAGHDAEGADAGAEAPNDGDEDDGNRTPTSMAAAAWGNDGGLVESTVEALDPDFGSMAQMRLRIIELSQEKDRLHAMMRARPCYLRLPDTMSDVGNVGDGASSIASRHSLVSTSPSTAASGAMPAMPPRGYARQYQPEQPIYAAGSVASAGSSSAPPSAQGRSGWWVDGLAAAKQQPQHQVVTGPRQRSRHFLTPTRRQLARVHRASFTEDDSSPGSSHPSPQKQQQQQHQHQQEAATHAAAHTPGHSKEPAAPLSWLSLGFDTPIGLSAQASAQSQHKHVGGRVTDMPAAHVQLGGAKPRREAPEASHVDHRRASFYLPEDLEDDQEFFL